MHPFEYFFTILGSHQNQTILALILVGTKTFKMNEGGEKAL